MAAPGPPSGTTGYVSQANRSWAPMVGLNSWLAPSTVASGGVNQVDRYERDTLVPYLAQNWGGWTHTQRK